MLMQTIEVIVRDQDGGDVRFRVKPHTKFAKISDAYCNKKAVGADTIKSVTYCLKNPPFAPLFHAETGLHVLN